VLEQKEVNENIIEELNDIDNKYATKNEEEMGEVTEEQYVVSENSNEDKTIKPTFVDTFKANLIDLVVIGGISAVGVFVVDAVLRLAGYFVTQKFQMSFIVFMIVMVLYMSIMESGKTYNTLGKKVSGLVITKR
jgi:uncharacterized RDD family membrane protein YckC